MKSTHKDSSIYYHFKNTWRALTIPNKGLFIFLLVSFVPSLSVLFMGLFARIGLATISPYIHNILLTISLLFIIPLLREKVHMNDLLLFLAIVVFIYISPMIWPASRPFVDENAGPFLWTVLPYMFIGLIIDYEQHKDILLAISRLALFIEIFVQFLIKLGITNSLGRADDGTSGEQMTAAYDFIFAAMYLFLEADHSRSIVDVVLAALAFILLLFMGTRGPIVVYGFFVMGYFMIFKKYESFNMLKKILIGLLFYLFYRFIDVFLLFLLPLAQALGFSTRVFDSIIGGAFVNLEESNGRNNIWETCFDALKFQPEGYGWGGDRYVVVGDWHDFFGYAHNFAIEILVQFGWVIGGAILLAVSILLLRALKKSARTPNCSFLFFLFCAGIMTLMTSQSYIVHPLLFLLIGYCVSLLRLPRRIVQNYN